jgi:rhodanese-related sulfurtransferase
MPRVISVGTLEPVTVKEISVHELAALGPSASIVDVREPHEWETGHIGHAVLVPLGAVVDNVDAFGGSPTYVVCRSGNRSGRACEFLMSQGLDVVNVAGGMLAWADAGFDIATGTSSGADGG